MKSALRRLLAIVWTILICVFLAWSYARHNGLSSPLKPPLSHPFTAIGQPFEIIAAETVSAKDPSAKSPWLFLDAAAQKSRDVILWLDVRPRRDGALVVAAHETESESAPLLRAALERYPDHRLVLNVRGYRPGVKESLIQAIESGPASRAFLIQSPEDGLLKDLRKERPLWLFGTSLAQITRLLMLSSIGLESQSPIRGDVVVLNDSFALSRLDDRSIREVRRRGLRLFAGPTSSSDDILRLRERGVDGVITSSLEALDSLKPHEDSSKNF